MATIRDIAKATGLSPATISRVLSSDEHFKVSAETKQLIFDTVKELGYDHATKSRAKKTAAPSSIRLGCILAVTAEKYSDPFFLSILSAIEDECKQHCGSVTLVRNYTELKDPRILHELCHSNLDGLFIMESLPAAILDTLKKHIPYMIAVDYYHTQLNSVGFDQIEATFQVLDHLYANGCRRIAYIGGSAPNTNFYHTRRMLAYQQRLKEYGIAYDETIIKDCNWDIESCANMTEELLQLKKLPDAIFAGSDTLAQIVLGKLYEHQLRCPQDIQVIGFNNLDYAAHLIPPLTTIDVPTKEIGKLAAIRLLELINTKDKRIYSMLLPTTLIVRNSTKEIPL